MKDNQQQTTRQNNLTPSQTTKIPIQTSIPTQSSSELRITNEGFEWFNFPKRDNTSKKK